MHGQNQKKNAIICFVSVVGCGMRIDMSVSGGAENGSGTDFYYLSLAVNQSINYQNLSQ